MSSFIKCIRASFGSASSPPPPPILSLLFLTNPASNSSKSSSCTNNNTVSPLAGVGWGELSWLAINLWPPRTKKVGKSWLACTKCQPHYDYDCRSPCSSFLGLVAIYAPDPLQGSYRRMLRRKKRKARFIRSTCPVFLISSSWPSKECFKLFLFFFNLAKEGRKKGSLLLFLIVLHDWLDFF